VHCTKPSKNKYCSISTVTGRVGRLNGRMMCLLIKLHVANMIKRSLWLTCGGFPTVSGRINSWEKNCQEINYIYIYIYIWGERHWPKMLGIRL